MRLWRISNYPDLSGIGGLKYAGRWHNKGRLIIYTAEHPALAMIETMVHFTWDTAPAELQLCTIEIENIEAIETITPPSDWLSSSSTTRAIGDEWLAANTALLLRIPSVIIPDSYNYLINPMHAQPDQLKVLKTQKVPLDQRLRKN